MAHSEPGRWLVAVLFVLDLDWQGFSRCEGEMSYIQKCRIKTTKLSPECDVPVPWIPDTGNFSLFWWYRNPYRKKVAEPVSEKFGTRTYFCRQFFKFWIYIMGTGTVLVLVSEKFVTGKKYCNQYRKNLVPEKSLGTGIRKIWYQNLFSSPIFF